MQKQNVKEALPANVVFIALFLVLTGVWFSHLNYRSLLKPDEGRYAEISREMNQSGDLVTPRLNGVRYFEKPPLHYWATAGAFALFGEHEWTARLWSALTGYLGILLVIFAGSRLFSPQAGFLAGLILSCNPFYFALSHINTIDMGLSVFMFLSLVGLLIGFREDESERSKKIWIHVAWVGWALAVLTKGPMGIVLPGASLVLYALFMRDKSFLRKLRIFTGLPLFLLIVSPWFILVALRNPGFLSFFFIHEHIDRYLTNVHNRGEPWWFLLAFLFGGFIPWVSFIFHGMVSGTTSAVRKWKFPDPSSAMLIIWCVFILLFFQMSSSKLPTYVLPIYPAMALLLGDWLTRLKDRKFLFHGIFLLACALAAVILAPKLALNESNNIPRVLYEKYGPWAISAAFLWFFGVAGHFLLLLRKNTISALIILSFSTLLSQQLLLIGHQELSPSLSSKGLAQKLLPYLEKRGEIPFYSIQSYFPTLPFYLKRTVTLVDFQDEMAMGLSYEPKKWIPKMETFFQLWREHPGALAVMSRSTYANLLKQGPPIKMELFAEDVRSVVVISPE